MAKKTYDMAKEIAIGNETIIWPRDMAGETYDMAKQTYDMEKETYDMANKHWKVAKIDWYQVHAPTECRIYNLSDLSSFRYPKLFLHNSFYLKLLLHKTPSV